MKGCLSLIIIIYKCVSIVKLLQQGAGKLTSVAKNRSRAALKNRNLQRMLALLGQQQRQICVQAIVTDELKSAQLRLIQFQLTLPKMLAQSSKGQLLLHTAHAFIAFTVNLYQHTANAFIAQLLVAAALPDINTTGL